MMEIDEAEVTSSVFWYIFQSNIYFMIMWSIKTKKQSGEIADLSLLMENEVSK